MKVKKNCKIRSVTKNKNTLKTNQGEKNNKKRAITGGYKALWVQWLLGRPATLQLSATVDMDEARSPQRFIPPGRYCDLKSCK